MSKKIIAITSAVCAAIALTAFIVSQNDTASEPQMQDTNYAFSDAAKNDEPLSYTLYDEGGIIIIKGTGGQIIETGISTESLRSYDRELLAKGIAVSTYDEVLMLLEDFNS